MCTYIECISSETVSPPTIKDGPQLWLRKSVVICNMQTLEYRTPYQAKPTFKYILQIGKVSSFSSLV